MGPSLFARLTGKSEKEMPFLEHLEELRRAILACLAALAICATGAYFVSGRVMDYIVVHSIGHAQFLRPMEAFSVRFKLALILGGIVALPFIMFQLWSFIVPGLLHHERRLVRPIVLGSTLLFLGGIAFSYWVMTPLMVQLLFGFGTEHVQANIAVDYLFNFILALAVGTGVMFQLPVVIVVLSALGLVTPRFLWSKWRHATVAIVIVAAIVTPGDAIFSTLVLTVPCLLLYFISAVLSSFIARGRRKRKERKEGAEQGDRLE